MAPPPDSNPGLRATNPSGVPVPLVLLLALVGISFAAPLVRLSHAHPLTIAIWRLGFALVFILGALVATGTWRQFRRLDRGGLALAAAAGIMLAFHFWSWNASVGMTTVAASVVLVNVQPALVALLSGAVLAEPPTSGQWVGIVTAMFGAFVVALPDLLSTAGAMTGQALTGDLLALVGAAAAAGYVIAGRRLRSVLDIWPYVSIVYGVCFVVLLIFARAVHAPILGQPPREMGIFLALAIGPMLFGHTGINWALKYMPAYVVNLTLLGEPVGATFLAALLPGIREIPRVATVVGGLLVLAGILVAARSTRQRRFAL
ncbi:MAG TPA: DMT family transporter [Gemmatimonadaceae bacterium]|jgi:drug/metabolite transporter (DMT)-like permease|nr:DMT family transporter [Gemmatimonadaceae bacterium]